MPRDLYSSKPRDNITRWWWYKLQKVLLLIYVYSAVQQCPKAVKKAAKSETERFLGAVHTRQELMRQSKSLDTIPDKRTAALVR
jgi:hypothetical protein